MIALMSSATSLFAAFVGCTVVAVSALSASLCDVTANRPAFDRKTGEVTAFVSHAFEDFTLFDPTCSSELSRVWVEYGGRFASGTIYCCGIGDERSRKKPLVVNGIVTTIVRDAKLKRFDALIQRPPDSLVRATLRGRFFAGEKTQLPGGTVWAGYGHFGLFSLFVIEQVLAVEPHNLSGIDYRAYPDRSAVSGVGCFSKPIQRLEYAEVIRQQQAAESGERAWAFRDPARVAAESLQAAVKSRPRLSLKVVRHTAGRVIYEGALAEKKNKYQIVVSKPYWLTFYSANRERIAWIAVASEEFGCDQNEE